MSKRLQTTKPISRMLLWSLLAALVSVEGLARAGETASPWHGPTLRAWPLATMIAAALLCAAILSRRRG